MTTDKSINFFDTELGKSWLKEKGLERPKTGEDEEYLYGQCLREGLKKADKPIDNLSTWPEKIFLQESDTPFSLQYGDELPKFMSPSSVILYTDGPLGVAWEVPYIRADLVTHENLRQQLHAATELITMFGDSVADVFEQMNKGNWVDDHGHDVQMNAKMLNLLPIMEKAVMFSKALTEEASND